ncbi:MAG: AEC family transporter [Alphaproteobacteria bacterium]|nr:AEC family transporter [Alphaproteobacteria bacterium]
MIEILLALAPIFLLIALGAALRRWALLPEDFWSGAEKLVYWGLFPCLLFRKAATAPLDELAVGPLMVVLLGAIAAAGAAVFALRPALRMAPQSFGSLFQGSIRMNTYVGFAVAAALAGEVGAALAAVAAAVMVPTVNALSIIVLLTLHGGAAGAAARGPAMWLQVLRGLVTHQLILAILLGLALNLAGLPIPPVLDGATEILAEAALPLALLTVGAGLKLGALAAGRGPLAAGLAVKLALCPAAAYGLAALLGVDGPTLLVAMIFAALPSSASGYHMARQMGGDAPLLAGLISAQTLLAAATLPLAILTAH